MPLKLKHLLGIQELAIDQIQLILETAESFREISTRPIKKVPTLRGKTVINLFFEASTRTRTSFEIAAKRLSADAINISASTSSVVKGETLHDTAQNLQAMAPDVIVIRHSSSGAPHQLARICDAAIVNAGDGAHEHPTQALLDAFTILDRKKRLEKLKVAIVGDIAHSRVARSNCLLLGKMGAHVTVCAPPTLLPLAFDRTLELVQPASAPGSLKVTHDMDEALQDADVVMMLRIQLERQQETFFPSVREYFRFYGLSAERMRAARPDAIIMHPGPINRGVEIASDVADGPYSVILDQVTSGVAVRMAVLFLLTGGNKDETTG
ncbi:MAG: aspartate carbamoyltransferase catalytic subunit [Acidobacteria bacterium]|nr:aspartate carbamoyltransferase catalytic subunit [Acidobacteriota bacterium]MCI0724629.1 aspartate carbamoyltransferase catalytic subunit [Acidobacteriota bacterium]